MCKLTGCVHRPCVCGVCAQPPCVGCVHKPPAIHDVIADRAAHEVHCLGIQELNSSQYLQLILQGMV